MDMVTVHHFLKTSWTIIKRQPYFCISAVTLLVAANNWQVIQLDIELDNIISYDKRE